MEGEGDRLQWYTRLKHGVAEQLRYLKALLKERDSERRMKECDELTVKLAEDRFTLAVLGQFKRGKSSLMNAVVGREVLPTGVLPLTSVITILKYGPAERLILHSDRFTWPHETAIAEIEDYATERGNPGNRRQINKAVLELPVEFLRRGVEFVDTPGIGSAIEANTATTYGFLPECDAAVFVTGVDSPLTRVETEFLAEIRRHVRKLFFVVNKTDLLAGAELQEALTFAARELQRQLDATDLKLFPLSCRLALAARAADDAEGLARSGLNDLETALAEFLSGEKAQVFLASIARRALALLEAEAGDIALRMRVRASQAAAGIATPKPGKDGKIPNLERDERTLAGIRTKLRALLAQAEGRAADSDGASDTAAAPATLKTLPLPPVRKRVEDLGDDLTTRGCPVCDWIMRWSFDFFAQWQYALDYDERTQDAFAADLGFCALHTWQLKSISSPQGTAMGYPKLVERLSRAIAQAAETPAPAAAVQSLVVSAKDCRVCALVREGEADYLRRLATYVESDEGRRAFAQSKGLCVRHLGGLVGCLGDRETSEFVLRESSRRFEELAEDLRNYVIKHDALRRNLHHADEEDAHARAIAHIAGGSGVYLDWIAAREI